MDQLKQLAKKIFQYEARLVLKKYKPKVIAITGSVGKTSTKEAIYLVLSKKYYVRKSEKSFTAELGVALTIIGCPRGTGSFTDWANNLLLGLKLLLFNNPYPEYLILELDGDKSGDLSMVSSFVSPDVLVLTEIGEVPAHIESFLDMEDFLFEKRSIINAVKREGLIVYNADDSVVTNLLKDTNIRKISCGKGNWADIHSNEFKILYSTSKIATVPTGMTFDIHSEGENYTVTIFQSLGLQNVFACLLAFSLGNDLKIKKSDILSSLNKFISKPGRMNLVNGIKNTTIIDDSYNSSPIALSQALSVFGSVQTEKNKIVVIGDMLELGKYSAVEHKKISEQIKVVANKVITVGFRARKIGEELFNLGFSESDLLSFDNAEEAGKALQNLLEEGDLVLVKGSQAMRMERVVEEIMRHPQDKQKILVRQEEEWQSR